MAMNMKIGGKDYKEYLAEKEKKNGTLKIKKGRQKFYDGHAVVYESTYSNSTLVPGDGDMTLTEAVAVLFRNGKSAALKGTIEFKGGVWYENGQKVDI